MFGRGVPVKPGGRRLLGLAAAAVIGAASIAVPVAVQAGASQASDGATVVPAISRADHRCFFGTGIQVWQDANKGGPTAIFCGTHIGSLTDSSPYDNLSRLAEQLSWGANWNDRISSFEIFNTGDGGTHLIHFCIDADGHNCTSSYNSSVYVAYVGNTFNDKISSIYDVGGN